MDEKLQKIVEIDIKKKVVALVVLLGILSAGYWYLMYQPVNQKLVELKKEVDSPGGLRSQVARLDHIAKNLDSFIAEVKHLDVELKKALRELPDKKEIINLLARISDKAQDSGLDVKTFKPLTEVTKEFYAEQPVKLEVRGRFHQVATFFDEVRHLDRIVNLKQFHIKEPDIDAENNYVSVNAGLTATAFRFLDADEIRVNEEESLRNRGKRRKKK